MRSRIKAAKAVAHGKGQRAALEPHNVFVLAEAPADSQAPRVMRTNVRRANLRESGGALQQAGGGLPHKRRRGQSEGTSGDSIFNCEAPALSLRSRLFHCGLRPLALDDTEAAGVHIRSATRITSGDHHTIGPAGIHKGEHQKRLGMEELSTYRSP